MLAHRPSPTAGRILISLNSFLMKSPPWTRGLHDQHLWVWVITLIARVLMQLYHRARATCWELQILPVAVELVAALPTTTVPRVRTTHRHPTGFKKLGWSPGNGLIPSAMSLRRMDWFVKANRLDPPRVPTHASTRRVQVHWMESGGRCQSLNAMSTGSSYYPDSVENVQHLRTFTICLHFAIRQASYCIRYRGFRQDPCSLAAPPQ